MISDAAAASLTVGQVVDLVNQAKAGGAIVVVEMQIFNNLGNDINVTGSTLNLALSDSGGLPNRSRIHAARERYPDNLKNGKSHCQRHSQPACPGATKNQG